MKKTLTDFVCILGASVVVILAFALCLIAFHVPNAIGLDDSLVSPYVSAASEYLSTNRIALVWCALFLFLATPVTIQVLGIKPRVRTHVSRTIHKLQSALRSRQWSGYEGSRARRVERMRAMYLRAARKRARKSAA